jgi:hypothetical protein
MSFHTEAVRLTDCRLVELPPSDILHLEANKTGKEADFDLSLSEVLPGLLKRRREIFAVHPYLLSTPEGQPVSERRLRDWFNLARAQAAKDNPELATRIKAVILRLSLIHI